MSRIISITGDLGSGKSTVSAILTEQLGYGYVYTGKIQREIAACSHIFGNYFSWVMPGNLVDGLQYNGYTVSRRDPDYLGLKAQINQHKPVIMAATSATDSRTHATHPKSTHGTSASNTHGGNKISDGA